MDAAPGPPRAPARGRLLDERRTSDALLALCGLLAASTVAIGALGYRAARRAQHSVLREHASAAATGLLTVARQSGVLGDEAALVRLVRAQGRGPASLVLTDLHGRLLAAPPGLRGPLQAPSATMLEALRTHEAALRLVAGAQGTELEYWRALPAAGPGRAWWPGPGAAPDARGGLPRRSPSPGELWQARLEQVRLLRVTVPTGVASALLAPARWGLALAGGLALLWSVLAVLLHREARRARAWRRDALREQTLSALADTAAVLAQELGAPTASLEHHARQLAQAQPGDQHLATMLRDGQRLVRLVQRLQELAAPCQPSFASVDPDLVAARAVEQVIGEAAHAGVTLVLDPAACGPCLQADGAQLTQVLVHLLYNALDAVAALPHALAAGRQLVLVRVQRRAGWVRLAVLDQGRGLGGADLDQLARPFFSTKASGAGLGLSLARRIVVEHGGRLELSDRPEGGAVATVELPERGPG